MGACKADEWARIQEKTFTRWVNLKLNLAVGEEPVENLFSDLSDGVNLTHLVSYLSPYTIAPIYKRPRHRLQKMENLNAVFEFMKFNGVHLYNIGSEDIFEGNSKLILGLIWTLILQFSVVESDSSSQNSTKTDLLTWCQRVTKDYKSVTVKNFSSSWNDGLALCAIIHHFHPELIDFSKLKPENRIQNTTLALEIATKRLRIPQLVDVEDLVSDNPDDKSITAYIIEWHAKFNGVAAPEPSELPIAESVPAHGHEDLLEWANELVPAKLTNLSTCFSDGTALCSIVSACIPSSKLVPGSNASRNRELALKAAAMVIKPKVTAEQLSHTGEEENPHLIAFLSDLRRFHILYPPTEDAAALEFIEKFVDIANEAIDAQKEYEDRAAKLIDAIDQQLESWGTLNQINHCAHYDEVMEERRNLNIYRLTVKRDWLKEKNELNILLGNIRTKLTTYNLHPYHPPGDLSPKFIECVWLSLTDIEKEAFRRINLIGKRIQDELCQQFSTTADAIAEAIGSCEEEISRSGGSLEAQLTVLAELLDTLKPVDEMLADLQNIDIACKEADIKFNEYTLLSYDELHYQHQLMRELITEKLSFIETQTTVKNTISTRKITPRQMEEFETIFKKVCAKNDKNSMSLNEFKKTLDYLDLDLENDEIIDLYKFGKKHSELYLGGFLKIMTELVGEDDINAEGLIAAFRQISGGKSFLTEEDLHNASLNEEVVQKIQTTFPKTSTFLEDKQNTSMAADTSYDFIQFVSEMAGLSFAAEGETLDGASILSQSSTVVDNLAPVGNDIKT